MGIKRRGRDDKCGGKKLVKHTDRRADDTKGRRERQRDRQTDREERKTERKKKERKTESESYD